MDSLISFSCRTLSSPTTCRFIPALSVFLTIRELASRIRKPGSGGQAARFRPPDESGHLYLVAHTLRKRESHEFLRPNAPHTFQQDSEHYRQE